MNKISTLALLAVLGLALPAYAQAPADEHADTRHEIHKEKMEHREEHKEKEHKREEHKRHEHKKHEEHKEHEEHHEGQ